LGKIDGSEYDPTRWYELGVDESAPFGVACGIQDVRGPGTSWHVRGRREDASHFLRNMAPGTLVTVPDPTSPGLLGRVVGVAQTQLWGLVRPHDCPHIMKHHPGLTPKEHITLRMRARERRMRWARDLAIALGATVVGGLIVWALTRA
jgi:hypothetical protein